MKKKKAQAPEGGGGSADWLATYSDMVTLLFTFFVLLFAISQVDVQKFNLLAAALSNKGATAEQIMEIGSRHNLDNKDEIDYDDPKIPLPLGEDEANLLQEAYEQLIEQIQQNGVSGKVNVALGDDYIFIRFVDEMLFNPNSAVIRQSDYVFLGLVGESIKSIEDAVGMIRVDGHTAAVPEAEDYPVSDRDLSSERANAVVKYFEENVGISAEKMTALTFGKNYPVADNTTEEGRKKNRRIEILVTKASDITTQLDDIYEKLVD